MQKEDKLLNFKFSKFHIVQSLLGLKDLPLLNLE